jgi:hypothetical protein
MQNFTLADKQALEALVEGGTKVYEVAYNPNVVGIGGGTSTPEADAIAAGLTQYYREATANLVEVIYIN